MTEKTSFLRANNVRHSAKPVMVGGPVQPTVAECTSEATVTDVRDENGDIREIHVTCECGKVTVVACQYAGETQNV